MRTLVGAILYYPFIRSHAHPKYGPTVQNIGFGSCLEHQRPESLRLRLFGSTFPHRYLGKARPNVKARPLRYVRGQAIRFYAKRFWIGKSLLRTQEPSWQVTRDLGFPSSHQVQTKTIIVYIGLNQTTHLIVGEYLRYIWDMLKQQGSYYEDTHKRTPNS